MEATTVGQGHGRGEPTPDLRIKLERGQRGTYAWEIGASAPGHDVGALLAVVREADARLRAGFGPDASGPGERAA